MVSDTESRSWESLQGIASHLVQTLAEETGDMALDAENDFGVRVDSIHAYCFCAPAATAEPIGLTDSMKLLGQRIKLDNPGELFFVLLHIPNEVAAAEASLNNCRLRVLKDIPTDVIRVDVAVIRRKDCWGLDG